MTTDLIDSSPHCDIRDKVFAIEDFAKSLPFREIGSLKKGEIAQYRLEVEHFFSEGLYARKLSIPKDTVIVGKLHKYKNFNILLKGKLAVLVGDKIEEVSAPFIVVSPAGTKRIARALEDSEWLTIHSTDETDLSKIEQTFTANSEQEWLDFANKQLELPLWHGLPQQ